MDELDVLVVINPDHPTGEQLDGADTLSEMRDVKHAFRPGLKAQPGMDW